MTVTRDAGFPVTAVNTTAGGTGLTWPAFTTPGPNRMVVAMYLSNGGTTNAISTFTSPNLTWTRQVNVVDAGNNWRVEVWTAWAASAVTGEVITSVDLAGSSNNTRSQIIWSFDGSDSAGIANPASTGAGTGSPSLAITASGAGSYLVTGFPYRSGGSDVTVDANTTSEFNQGTGGGFGFSQRAGSRTSSGAGALTLGWNTNTPFAWLTIGGLEVKVAAGGGGAGLPFEMQQDLLVGQMAELAGGFQ